MSVTPTATGQLEATPFGHLLVYALDRGLTGTLVLEEATGKKHAIFFEQGAPMKAKTADPVVYLGQVLVEQHLITREVYEKSLETALHERRLHGAVLMERGAIDEVVLRAALREQISRQVLWMFKLPANTLYGYYERTNFLERWGGAEGVRVKPLALIWRGIRRHTPLSEVEAVTARLGERPIELHVNAPIQRFRFEPAERAVIDVLRAKPQALTELLGRGLGAAEDIRRLVYALVILRQLETGVPGAEPVGVDEAPSSSRMAIPGTSMTPPPQSLPPLAGSPRGSIPDIEPLGVQIPISMAPPPRITSPLPGSGSSSTSGLRPSVPAPGGPIEMAMRRELAQLIDDTPKTLYDVLGVPHDAPVDVIQNAFFVLAKKWHPDRLRPELADLRESAARAFARLSEAHRVLSDPPRRRAYDQSLATGGSADEQEHVQKVLQATTAFQKAEIFLKRGNLAQAEREAKLALEGDPQQADHVALYAWIQSQKPDADVARQLAELDRAVKMEEANVRARWYRGQLLKRAGKERQALADFRFVVDADPRHVDAQREVRLYLMRRAGKSSDPPRRQSDPARPPSLKPAPPSDKPGLLGKLFKKPNH